MLDSPRVHLCSVKHLYQYRCGGCDAWWTIPDRYVEAPVCPWCGHKAAALKAPLPPDDESF